MKYMKMNLYIHIYLIFIFKIIRYLHLCLFMSAGLNGPSPLENVKLLSTYIQQDPTFASVKKYINLLKELLLVSKGEVW